MYYVKFDTRNPDVVHAGNGNQPFEDLDEAISFADKLKKDWQPMITGYTITVGNKDLKLAAPQAAVL